MKLKGIRTHARARARTHTHSTGGAVLASLLPLDINWQRMVGRKGAQSVWDPLFFFVTRYSGTDALSNMVAKQQTPDKFMKLEDSLQREQLAQGVIVCFGLRVIVYFRSLNLG